MLQQCHFLEETVGKGLDNILNRLVPFSLLKDGPFGHKNNYGVLCWNTSTSFANKDTELHTSAGQNMLHQLKHKTHTLEQQLTLKMTHQLSPEDVVYNQEYGAVLSTGFRLKQTKTQFINSVKPCCFIDIKILSLQ